jgi:hypothetical protein
MKKEEKKEYKGTGSSVRLWKMEVGHNIFIPKVNIWFLQPACLIGCLHVPILVSNTGQIYLL